jgi:hypothetical protein
MVTNNGNTDGLFRAGFMQSGALLPVGDITNGQPFFDMLVNNTGCSSARDKLDCLRSVSEEEFQNAVDLSPAIFGFMVCAIITNFVILPSLNNHSDFESCLATQSGWYFPEGRSAKVGIKRKCSKDSVC